MSTALMERPRRRTMPIRVDFKKNAWDRKVEMLAREGLYATTIAGATGLTAGQVRYRVKQAGYGQQYRRGQDERSRKVMERIDKLLAHCRHLRKEFAEARGKGRGRRQ